MKTPWASVAPAQMSVSQAIDPTNQRLMIGGTAPSRKPTSGTGLTSPVTCRSRTGRERRRGEYRRFQGSPLDYPDFDGPASVRPGIGQGNALFRAGMMSAVAR